MVGLQKLFAWVPYARLAPVEIASLLEMSADDYSSRRNDPRHLAAALVLMATSGHVPSCTLGAAGAAIPIRVERLLHTSRNSKRTAVTTGCIAGAIISAPLALMVLA